MPAEQFKSTLTVEAAVCTNKKTVIIFMSVNGGFYLLYYSGAGRETL